MLPPFTYCGFPVILKLFNEVTRMTLFATPRSFSSFKEVRLYSVEWAQETLIGHDLEFHVVSKRGDSTYWDHGIFTSLTEAFAARRALAASDANHSYFLRASKMTYEVTPSSPEASDGRDLWQDAWRTGQDHLVPADQQAEYKVWAAKKTVNKYARFQFDRDAPRWD